MTDESADQNALREPNGRRAIRAPGWITSLGALCSLFLGAFNATTHQVTESEAEKRAQQAEQRLLESQRRIWDGINAIKQSDVEDRKADALAREHLRDRLHDELLAEIYRYLDQRCAPHGVCRER